MPKRSLTDAARAQLDKLDADRETLNDAIEEHERLGGDPLPPPWGVLYVISDGSGCVKVGISSNIRRRLTELQMGNPRQLSLEWYEFFPLRSEARDAEVAIQGALKRHASGEWYECSVRHVDKVYMALDTDDHLIDLTPFDSCELDSEGDPKPWALAERGLI
ncbi:hypothetical protein GS636_21475 [Ruegeria sp. HKCCD4884]|uniref:GIY-YIG nuclease family protein n=1 Tax=Ruegeria sp. HKCCD4884 TaxID=2683022 RepID=UPI0014912A6F|nr:GIY-YIG nuclease family protein [Ruegeria sp. HKCCD4884]NOD95377.1 hypothetical protein [Ruegeria sp. HKCCD4884]